MDVGTTKRRLSLRRILLVLLALALIGPVSAWARATTYRDTETFPFYFVGFNPCTQEYIELSGWVRVTSRTTIDSRGGYHASFHLVPQQVRGVGLSSGTQYKAVGGARDILNADFDRAPFTFTSTSMFNLISQGGSSNLQLSYTFHLTVNARGQLTGEVNRFKFECSGKPYPYPGP